MAHVCKCKQRFYSAKEVAEICETQSLEWKNFTAMAAVFKDISKTYSELACIDYYAVYSGHVFLVGYLKKELSYYDYNLETKELARVWANDDVRRIYKCACMCED